MYVSHLLHPREVFIAATHVYTDPTIVLPVFVTSCRSAFAKGDRSYGTITVDPIFWATNPLPDNLLLEPAFRVHTRWNGAFIY